MATASGRLRLAFRSVGVTRSPLTDSPVTLSPSSRKHARASGSVLTGWQRPASSSSSSSKWEQGAGPGGSSSDIFTNGSTHKGTRDYETQRGAGDQQSQFFYSQQQTSAQQGSCFAEAGANPSSSAASSSSTCMVGRNGRGGTGGDAAGRSCSSSSSSASGSSSTPSVFLSRAGNGLMHYNLRYSPFPSHRRRQRLAFCESSQRALQHRQKSSLDRARPRRERNWNAAFGRPPPRIQATGAFNSVRLGLAQLEGNTFCEDRYAFDELYVGGSSVFLVSVYDGHGGWQVAHFLERNLLNNVREKLFESMSASNGFGATKDQAEPSMKRMAPTRGPGPPGAAPAAAVPTVVGDKGIKFTGTVVPTAVDASAIEGALRSAYYETDELLKRRIQESVSLGFDRFVRLGSCAITVAVSDSHYVIANAGDCRAILCRSRTSAKDPTAKPEIVTLSTIHNANELAERERFRSERPEETDLVQCMHAYQDPKTGRLFQNPGPGLEEVETACYIKGVLQPTRAFGDFALKCSDLNVTLGSFPATSLGAPTGNKSSTYSRPVVQDADFSKGPYITAEPEIKLLPRQPEDEFVIVASDGLYDLLQDEEIISIARAAGSPELAAGALTEAVKSRAIEEAGLSPKDYELLTPSQRRDIHDDVTVGVFYLQFPEHWRNQITQVSQQLQKVCDDVLRQVGNTLNGALGVDGSGFSVCIADPSLEDCPLIAVSQGFEELTGYPAEDCIGRNCRFLNYGVPSERFDEETRQRLRAFTDVAVSGDPLAIAGANIDPPTWARDITGGGAYFLRWNRKKTGELFQNLFVLRQIWVDDKTYLIALQTKLSGGTPGELLSAQQLADLNRCCDVVSRNISKKITGLEQALRPQNVGEPQALRDIMRPFRKKQSSGTGKAAKQ
ncbi:unnamed protein product [Amoebophrya sp. A120]|nr:unnamed protein product [Amoebophrya sp. A120]|eukprot:GSA120T00025810001.1